MAFFDDLSKKVGDLTQNAVKKSSNMVEITKLNNSISGEEKNIQALYYELGRNYYSTCGSNPDNPQVFAEFCARIKQHENNIQAFREKIIELKDISLCPACGNQVEKGHAFCDKCGARIVQDAPVSAGGEVSSHKVCPNCGNQVEKEHAFCDKCGSKVPEDSPAPADVDSASPALCPACGSRVEEGQAFCAQCGTRFIGNPAESADKSLLCPNCNNAVTEDMAFCMNCGTKIK